MPIDPQSLAAHIEREIGGLPRFNDVAEILVIVTARSGGRVLRRAWTIGPSGDAIRQAIAQAIGEQATPEPDALEINLGHSRRLVQAGQLEHTLANVHSGLRGIAIEDAQGIRAVLGPTETIAANRPLRKALVWLLGRIGESRAALEAGRFRLSVFETAQAILWLTPTPHLSRLYRAAPLVTPAEVTRECVTALAAGMTRWMLNQVDETGRIVYKYWPSKGAESSADNSIRRVMATLCLGRIALRSGRPGDRAIADRNLDHLLRVHYRSDGTLGVIAEGPKAKLGAAALAALAILEHPARDRYREPLRQLTATVDHLWQEDGTFRTFLTPATRNDNQNFYPGEALLFWAGALGQRLPNVTFERYMRSFHHYRDFFRANPNPAFVPWHSQAHVAVHELRPEPQLAAFVFEMNDWLLSMQQWEKAPYPDLQGRFYDPDRPQYGPSHASSTGVYLEGLIDAWHLARQLGMAGREEKYRCTIARGLRSLRQLQFAAPSDMFYVSRKEAVEGGIRTETYDNTIRVDNVQHGLMGIHRILDRFATGDYITEAANRL